MNNSSLTTIAAAVVSLLVPYLKNLVEGLVKRSGEEIGTKMGIEAWGKAKQLYEFVKSRFSQQPNTTKIIAQLEKFPDDEDTQAIVRFQLKEEMASDENFARELANLLKEASEAGVDTIFHTTIVGSVHKLVQIGNVYGDVNI